VRVVLQVAAHVIGCDATITFCGQAGNFELNTMMPLLTLRLIEAIQFSANVVNALVEKCITGIVADRALHGDGRTEPSHGHGSSTGDWL